jgi:Ca-activated chloride channel family protein
MHFAYQHALWLLLMIPLVLWLVRLQTRRQQHFVRRLGEPHVLRQTPSRYPALARPWIRFLLVLLLFGGTILALADPRLPYGAPRLRAGSLDVVMIIDVSKSMGAEDYHPDSRLSKARAIILEMLPQLRGNRVGFVTFAGNGFRQAELSEDFTALEFILKHWISIDSAGVGGSDLIRALETGLAVLPEEIDHRERFLVLFSDGGDEAQNFAEVLPKIVQRQARVIAFGMGRPEQSRIPRYDAAQKFLGYIEANGQTVTTRLNEAPLQHIARGTQGLYRRVEHRDSWQNVWRNKTVVGQALIRDERRVFQPFLIVSLLAFGMQAVIARL